MRDDKGQIGWRSVDCQLCYSITQTHARQSHCRSICQKLTGGKSMCTSACSTVINRVLILALILVAWTKEIFLPIPGYLISILWTS